MSTIKIPQNDGKGNMFVGDLSGRGKSDTSPLQEIGHGGEDESMVIMTDQISFSKRNKEPRKGNKKQVLHV